jgi:predicted metal-dependent HD superfamily phosphohydrolase
MVKEKFLDVMGRYSDKPAYHLECWRELETAYTSRARYYHNLEHLEQLLTELDPVKAQVGELDTLLFAIFYHDIVYKPTKSNNEQQSALLFKKRISQTSFPRLEACIQQIEATKDHKPSLDHDTNILLDLDLSILGKSPKAYQTYRENIRKEFGVYPDFVYRKGRKQVLEDLLARASIFKTDFFKAAYEQQARENIRLELDQLG